MHTRAACVTRGSILRIPAATCTPADFAAIVNAREPVIFEGCTFGRAMAEWTPAHLQASCGDKLVSAHVCSQENMDFHARNFKFEVMPFAQLVQRVLLDRDQQNRCYLRSMGVNMRKDPSDLRASFPPLAESFALPSFVPPQVMGEDFFSSCLRISSAGIRLWTHYDVMDNVLCNLTGRKHVLLWEPADADNLYVEGSSSLVIDVAQPDLIRFPKYARARAVPCLLAEGDMLFLPSLWHHNVQALEPCVAVNVFWRHLPKLAYDGKDIYGNRDLVPAAAAQAHLDKATLELLSLPPFYRDFYARRAMAQLAVLLEGGGGEREGERKGHTA